MLIELLRRAAREVPDQPVVVTPTSSTSYAECLSKAERLARGLRERGVDRFACVLSDVGDLVALLGASTLTGSEACVYPDDADEATIARNAAAFEHDVIVRDGTLADLEMADGPLPEPPPSARTLILTTGTTGHQKGARHEWSRVAASVRHPDGSPGVRWLLAYNLHQFAGIQVLLHVLMSRATLVVPGSRRPRDVVAVLRELGVTHASATPTFWRTVVPHLDRETARSLPLRQVTLGGEAVPSSLLDELTSLFPGARISQIYGATEFGLGVSVRDGRAGLPVSLLERDCEADVQLRVVDGELHVRSRIGMLGYHGENEVDDDWRPTGDLVDVRGDRVHFVGRATDVINVGGVKVHPFPVEELVARVPGVRLVRAYGRPNPITGQIVAVDVVADPSSDTAVLERAVRDACRSLPRPNQPRLVRFVADIERRGEKIVRPGA